MQNRQWHLSISVATVNFTATKHTFTNAVNKSNNLHRKHKNKQEKSGTDLRVHEKE